MGYYGFDTASTLTNSLLSSAKTVFNNGGNTAHFVARYFSPTPGITTFNSSSTNANNEVNAMIAESILYLVPISSPTQSRIATGGSTGTGYGDDDASQFCNAIGTVYNEVGQFYFPSNGELHVYLDIEGGTTPTSAYCTAWIDSVDAHTFVNNSSNDAPYFPCFYANPGAGTGVCTVAAGGTFGIWASESEPCGDCDIPFGPSWGPETCSGLTSLIWQYAERGSCTTTCGKGWTPNVDTDMINGSGELNYMISV